MELLYKAMFYHFDFYFCFKKNGKEKVTDLKLPACFVIFYLESYNKHCLLLRVLIALNPIGRGRGGCISTPRGFVKKKVKAERECVCLNLDS